MRAPVSRRSPIYVTRPALPPLAAVLPLLEEIWASRILANNGPMAQRLEAALCRHLGVGHLSLVANATLGLVLALRQLGVGARPGDEVVTTPFSFVATAHAVRLAGATPVFADIDPATLTLDPAAAARAIGPATRAILAVHCYGTPCDLAGLAALAGRHALPVVYDAAHAFGVRTAGGSVLRAGTLSVLSFHATKVFGTAEGGAVVAPDRATKAAIDRLANHGIADEASIPEVGLNAKMSELHAALGIAQLGRVEADIAARGAVARRYAEGLAGVAGLRLVCPPERPGQNFYAFPVLVGPDYPVGRDALAARLGAAGIFARRYFFPLISDLPPYRGLPSADPAGLPVARAAAAGVLCLPMFPELDPADQHRVIDLLRHP